MTDTGVRPRLLAGIGVVLFAAGPAGAPSAEEAGVRRSSHSSPTTRSTGRWAGRTNATSQPSADSATTRAR
ncbi:hypothetical protein [Methylobacterium nodulans]|uniref:hypothetical protein n=1 Tax=Methylobacterium nodulans TaxID=114616 RepID=UPI0001617850|nr:hypothetical protein [Methylobacterium nodulans]